MSVTEEEFEEVKISIEDDLSEYYSNTNIMDVYLAIRKNIYQFFNLSVEDQQEINDELKDYVIRITLVRKECI